MSYVVRVKIRQGFKKFTTFISDLDCILINILTLTTSECFSECQDEKMMTAQFKLLLNSPEFSDIGKSSATVQSVEKSFAAKTAVSKCFILGVICKCEREITREALRHKTNRRKMQNETPLWGKRAASIVKVAKAGVALLLL